jgi:tRNA pseudouridine55 synthase
MALEPRVLLVDKPAGVSSFAVVRAVRRAARVAKAGHCGSLDPLATGLLIVCTGAATRVADEFVGLPKEYAARVRFGRSTDSYDADGRTTAEAPVPGLDPAAVRAALDGFVGEIEQRPPMVSAVKVQGKRLYELARRGVEVERAPRKVRVHAIDLAELGADHAAIRVRCGRGCYVRSIAHELGERLGVPAHLEALRREAIGGFRAADAVAADALGPLLEQEALGDAAAHARLARAARTVPDALGFLPELRLCAPFEPGLRNGMQPTPATLVAPPVGTGRHCLLSEDGDRLLAIVDAGRGGLRLALVFATPVARAAAGTFPP